MREVTGNLSGLKPSELKAWNASTEARWRRTTGVS